MLTARNRDEWQFLSVKSKSSGTKATASQNMGYNFIWGSWNVMGALRSFNKRESVVQHLRDWKIDICGLQETQMRITGHQNVNDYLLIHANKMFAEVRGSGLGFLVHRKLEPALKSFKIHSERICALLMNFQDARGNSNICFINIHAPTQDLAKQDPDLHDNFYIQLIEVYAFYSSKSNHVILLGDWNARLGSRSRSDDRLLIGPHTMEGRRNQNHDYEGRVGQDGQRTSADHK
jgi:exonuclease III